VPRRRRSMSRKRRNNPTNRQIAIAAAVGLGALVVGYGISEAVSRRPAKKGKSILPPPPEGASVSDPRYPGFESTDSGIVPTPETPPGIYVLDDCQDFAFVPGSKSNQAKQLSRMITAAINRSKSLPDEPQGPGLAPGIGGFATTKVLTDPIEIATKFLSMQWPDCQWPPSPDASSRIQQLFISLALLIGRRIVLGGGKVFGTSDAQSVDELVVSQIEDMGLDDYDPSIVPEIELPGIGGIDFDEPEPPQGGLIDLGDGPVGPAGSPEQPDAGGWVPTCLDNPIVKTSTQYLPQATWYERKTASIKLMSGEPGCDEFEVRFGICIGTDSASFGDLDPYVSGNPPDDVGEVSFKIRNADELQPIDYDQWQGFRVPIWWKAKYKLRIRFVNGKVSILNPGAPLSTIQDPSIDPCPQKQEHWPLSPNYYYFVVGQDDDERMWNPLPRLKRVKAVGDALYAEIEYSGLPRFKKDGDEARASLDVSPGLQCKIKIQYTGTSAE